MPDDFADVITQFAAAGITRYATAARVGHDTRWIWFDPSQLQCSIRRHKGLAVNGQS